VTHPQQGRGAAAITYAPRLLVVEHKASRSIVALNAVQDVAIRRIREPKIGARSALAVTLFSLGMLAATARCSSEAPTEAAQEQPGPAQAVPSASRGTNSIGQIDVAFTSTGGAGITAFTWSVTGPGGAATVVESGVVQVNASGPTAFTVGLGTGTGYALSLSATSPDAGTSCSGTATFDVTAGATTYVTIILQCVAAHTPFGSDAGAAQAPGCAAWTSVAASPSEATVGHSLSLAATATAADPGSIAYFWSAPSGTIDAPTSATANFTCTAPGQVPVTLMLGDRSPDGSDVLCGSPASSTTITVQCDSLPSSSAPAMPPWATLLLGALLGSAAVAVRRARKPTL
jgi:hypothetical protein